MREGRVQRVAGQLQQEIATIIQRELKDPRLGFVTVTRVELSKDLSHARVHYSCLGGDEERDKSQEGLDNSASYIHELIKKRFRLKTIPRIQFQFDESIAKSIEISDKLERLDKEEHIDEAD